MTKDALYKRLENMAGQGAPALEAVIRDYNCQAAEIAERARRRAEEREACAVMIGHRAFEAWLAGQRQAFVEAARAEFDAKHPPIAVPERVELSEAKRIAKGAA